MEFIHIHSDIYICTLKKKRKCHMRALSDAHYSSDKFKNNKYTFIYMYMYV